MIVAGFLVTLIIVGCIIPSIVPISLMKKCRPCNAVKGIAEFHKHSRNKDGLYSYCKSCTNARIKAYRMTKDGFLSKLVLSSRSNSHNVVRKHVVGTHTLTFTQFKETLAAQKDRCAYSNVPLAFKPHSDWQCSAERINNKLTYTQDNVCAIALEFQNRNQWSVAKVTHAFSHETTAVDEAVLATMFDLPVTQRKAQEKQQTRVVDGVEQISCNFCKEFKNKSLFSSKKSKCKECFADYNKERIATWRGCLILLANTSRRTTKQRIKRGRTMDESEVTLELLIELFREQKGLCYYSGLQLTNRGNWKVSLERLNVTVGYIKTNICLICQEFNSQDRSASNPEAEGCSGWSKEKYAYVRTLCNDVTVGNSSTSSSSDKSRETQE